MRGAWSASRAFVVFVASKSLPSPACVVFCPHVRMLCFSFWCFTMHAILRAFTTILRSRREIFSFSLVEASSLVLVTVVGEKYWVKTPVLSVCVAVAEKVRQENAGFRELITYLYRFKFALPLEICCNASGRGV